LGILSCEISIGNDSFKNNNKPLYSGVSTDVHVDRQNLLVLGGNTSYYYFSKNNEKIVDSIKNLENISIQDCWRAKVSNLSLSQIEFKVALVGCVDVCYLGQNIHAPTRSENNIEGNNKWLTLIHRAVQYKKAKEGKYDR